MMTEVASRLTGDESKFFTGFDISTKLKPIGVDVASFGQPFEEEGAIPIVFEDGYACIGLT